MYDFNGEGSHNHIGRHDDCAEHDVKKEATAFR